VNKCFIVVYMGYTSSITVARRSVLSGKNDCHVV